MNNGEIILLFFSRKFIQMFVVRLASFENGFHEFVYQNSLSKIGCFFVTCSYRFLHPNYLFQLTFSFESFQCIRRSEKAPVTIHKGIFSKQVYWLFMVRINCFGDIKILSLQPRICKRYSLSLQRISLNKIPILSIFFRCIRVENWSAICWWFTANKFWYDTFGSKCKCIFMNYL